MTRHESQARSTEGRLARLSVLQELTVSALDLFDPDSRTDPFLQRLAERLGCLAVLWLAVTPGRASNLVGAAGLSEASRALPIALGGEGGSDIGSLPYPELARPGMTHWRFGLAPSSDGGAEPPHVLLLFFDPQLKPPDELRPTVERLTGVLGTVWTHRQLAEALRRSYADLARAQLALVERERLAAVGELAAVVAHEVRNPLAVMFNCIATLRKRSASPEDAEALVAMLAEEARRLDGLVSELLDFARPGEVLLADESLEQVVRGALQAVSAAEPALRSGLVQLHLASSGPLRSLMLDGRLVHRAVINMVSNAVHAMPGGGRIVVRLAEDVLDQRPAVRLEIEDDGPGIAPEQMARIFEPFFTTRPSGTGLGLSIVKRIAEAHHGELTVRSEGRGSTFVMRLPALLGERASTRTTPPR